MAYQHASNSNSNANSMQLMPYTAQTKTLNPDELTKLYNMNPYNRPIIVGGSAASGVSGMVSFPNVPTGIGLGHQPNNNTNIASQMSLAQGNTNPAQYLTSTPYLQQQGIFHSEIDWFSGAQIYAIPKMKKKNTKHLFNGNKLHFVYTKTENCCTSIGVYFDVQIIINKVDFLISSSSSRCIFSDVLRCSVRGFPLFFLIQRILTFYFRITHSIKVRL